MTIYWPEALPKTLSLNGLSVQRNSSVVRTQMDAGARKARRRYTASTKIFTGKMLLNYAQRMILEDFYHTVLGDGVLRFIFLDPQTLETGEFRFREDYTEYSVEGFFEIQMSLEKL
jgi:hypothetical protein